MLKQGAKLVETPDDVLEEFGYVRKKKRGAPKPASASWASARVAEAGSQGDARILGRPGPLARHA